MRSGLKIVFMLWMVATFLGCSDYDKLLRSTNKEEQRNRALKYYEKKDYYRALGLFEIILPYFRLSSKGEEIYYKYCYCHYYQKDLYLAGYYFKNFTKSYPGSDKVEECLYMSAQCHVQLSPAYYLDQTDTKDAIRDLQIFINRFPNSPKKDTCNYLIDKLQLKLDTKEYENAYLYLKTENYKSAVVAFQALLQSNPGTPFKEKVMFQLIEAGYKYAKNSIDTKKPERLQETLTFYIKFVAAFPESEFRSEADGYKRKVEIEMKRIERLKNK